MREITSLVLNSRIRSDESHSGENWIIRTARAIVASVMVTGLLLFALDAIFIGPFQANGYPSSRRTTADFFPLDDKMKPPVWSVIAYASLHVVQDATRQTDNSSSFYQALNVTALKDSDGGVISIVSITCLHVPMYPAAINAFQCEQIRPHDSIDESGWVVNPYKFGVIAITALCPTDVVVKTGTCRADQTAATYNDAYFVFSERCLRHTCCLCLSRAAHHIQLHRLWSECDRHARENIAKDHQHRGWLDTRHA